MKVGATDIAPIKTQRDYRSTLKEIERAQNDLATAQRARNSRRIAHQSQTGVGGLRGAAPALQGTHRKSATSFYHNA